MVGAVAARLRGSALLAREPEGVGRAGVVRRHGRRALNAGLLLQERAQAEARAGGQERVLRRDPVTVVGARGLGARPVEEHHVEAWRVLLVVGALKRNVGTVVQHRVIRGLQCRTRAGSRLYGGDLDFAHPGDEPGVGCEIRGGRVGAGGEDGERQGTQQPTRFHGFSSWGPVLPTPTVGTRPPRASLRASLGSAAALLWPPGPPWTRPATG